MADKYIKLSNGRLAEQAAVETSAGAGDAGKIVALSGDGRLDPSVMPAGIGADVATVVASENLSAGDFVNIWDDAGSVKVRKADSSSAGYEADGFVLDAVTSGQNASVYFEGRNTGKSGLTIGARYYLGATGGVTTTPPSAGGNVVQFLGRAISATAITFEGTDGVIVA